MTTTKSKFDYYLTQGDGGKVMRAVLQDAEGVALDLSDGLALATVTFSLGTDTNLAEVFLNAPAVADADQIVNRGHVAFTWQTSQTAQHGTFFGQFHVSKTDGTELTVPTEPFRVAIRKKIT